MRTKLLLAATAMLCAGPAFAQPDCLQFGRIYSFNAPDNKTLIVEDDLHQKFKLSLFGTCIGLNFKENVGFKSRGAMQLTCMSAGDSVIVQQNGIGPQNCPIRTIVPYTAEMQKADEAAAAARANGVQPQGGYGN